MARILIIDDDQSISDLATMILASDGHESLVADTALDALDLLEVYDVDLIIADVNMPRFNGFDFVSTIKKNPRLEMVPIAFMSSSDDQENISRAGQLGANFYLLKPLERVPFLQRINTFFATHPTERKDAVEFAPPFQIRMKIHQSAEILTVTDLGVEVRLPTDLKIGQIIEIPSEVLNGVPEGDFLVKVSWMKELNTGTYHGFLSFVDRRPMVIRKIQRVIKAKNQATVANRVMKRR